ncbi:hypothetical protein ACYPKM_05590 [Pseudomonas aeruginosa]
MYDLRDSLGLRRRVVRMADHGTLSTAHAKIMLMVQMKCSQEVDYWVRHTLEDHVESLAELYIPSMTSEKQFDYILDSVSPAATFALLKQLGQIYRTVQERTGAKINYDMVEALQQDPSRFIRTMELAKNLDRFKDPDSNSALIWRWVALMTAHITRDTDLTTRLIQGAMVARENPNEMPQQGVRQDILQQMLTYTYGRNIYSNNDEHWVDGFKTRISSAMNLLGKNADCLESIHLFVSSGCARLKADKPELYELAQAEFDTILKHLAGCVVAHLDAAESDKVFEDHFRVMPGSQSFEESVSSYLRDLSSSFQTLLPEVEAARVRLSIARAFIAHGPLNARTLKPFTVMALNEVVAGVDPKALLDGLPEVRVSRLLELVDHVKPLVPYLKRAHKLKAMGIGLSI